jgi:hypothetical protein
MRFDNVKFKLFEINSEPFGREFWKVNLRLGLIGNKTIENVIENTINSVLTINNGTIDLVSVNIPFAKVSDVDYESNLIDDSKDRIIDYNKISSIVKLKFYRNASDLYTFFSYLKDVGTFATNYKLKHNGILYGQYSLTKEKIGQDYYEINLDIYSLNEINVPNTI